MTGDECSFSFARTILIRWIRRWKRGGRIDHIIGVGPPDLAARKDNQISLGRFEAQQGLARAKAVPKGFE